jgi:hypothetical protein
MTLEQQLAAILERKSANLGRVAQAVAEDLSDKSIENTLMGKGFGNDRYDNWYEPSVARRKGSDKPVTLRNGRNRIENQVVVLGGNKATISFQDAKGGEILRYHHQGIQYAKAGFKQRSIFPQEPQSVPMDTVQNMRKLIIEVLT